MNASARADNGGAYGLWIAPSSSVVANANPGCLAAIIYVETGSLWLKGTSYEFGLAGNTSTQAGAIVKSLTTNNVHSEFEIIHHDGTTETSYLVNFDKSASNSNSNYIRNVIPTNPQKTNSKIYDSTNELWLGETFDEMVDRNVKKVNSTTGEQYGILVHLGGAESANYAKYEAHRRAATSSKSGWFVSQDFGNQSSYTVETQQRLFRMVALHEGEWMQKNYQIGIEIQKLGSNVSPYSSFHLYVMDMGGNSIEQFKNLNLNPGSSNYIAKRIGDQFQTWDNDQKKYRVEGQYGNVSDLVRVELAEAVVNGSLSSLSAAPFGVQGPVVYQSFIAKNNPDALNPGKLLNSAGAAAYRQAD
jgi:hypothetical protein